MANKFEINDVEIEYLSHSGFLIHTGEKCIAIDPFLDKERNPYAKLSPAEIKANDIVITHGHSDHLADAPEIAKNNDATVISTFPITNRLAAMGVKTNPIAIGGTLKLNWGELHARLAIHSGLFNDGTDFGMAASMLFRLPGATIYHLGDTALHLDFKLVGEVYRPDVALVPIGGRFTMDVDEAVMAVKWLGVKIAIPMHYNTFPFIQAAPEEFKAKVDRETGVKCVVLAP